MTTRTEIRTIFDTTLERAFKTPMLCDVTKIHTGSSLTPRVTHTTEDETWGRKGGSRKIFMAKTWNFKGGEASLDTVLEREENAYWKIEISDFKMPSMGFKKFQGEWFTSQRPDGRIEIRYAYTMYSKSILYYPFHLFFTKVLWKKYMWQVMENIRALTKLEEPYVHD